MEIEIDQKIFDICKSHIRCFKSECLNADYDYFKNKYYVFTIFFIKS